MTIDVHVESCGLRFSALVITNDLITHSTLQETPEEHIEQCKLEIRTALIKLALEAGEYRKDS
jgi:hypothetical protein